MYRGSSPIFDVPEIPPLRRVKPLPKRRRTSADPLLPIPDTSQYVPGMIPAEGPVDMTAFGLNMPLPQYYMPMFNGVQDLFRMGNEDQPLEYPGGFAVSVGTMDEEDHGDGDYVDHLQQPGNAKKRKVPAAHHSAADPLSSPTAMADNELDEHGHLLNVTGRTDGIEVSDVAPAIAAPGPPLFVKKNRSSPATLAGLQHKELLKTRKRQLAAVLGALSHGDTLALDQALSARYSSTMSLSGQYRVDEKENDRYQWPRRRWSKRRVRGWELMPAPNTSNEVPAMEFTFACPSPTSERLISTREEVAVLHSRFEAELSRQAAKAAEVARQNALATENGTITKRGNREQQRLRSSGTITAPNSNSGILNTSGGGAKSRTSKKKKRSALANASNPHHLRNYVPSRIPHSGQAPPAHTQGGVNTQNLVSPPPTRFLAAEIAPQRRKKDTPTHVLSMAPLSQSEDEWVCAFCEYNLFYGEEPAFRRAVRSRKKILVRRRRAREKAAAAASGQKTAAAPMEKSMSETFDSPLDEEFRAGDIDAQKPVKHGIPAASRKERDKQPL